jgi:uncharacterized YkwD family protein/spore coat assembly protein SafA
MKKWMSLALAVGMTIVGFTQTTSAATNSTYTVQLGDTLWKIAAKYQVGTSELISANPQLSNPSMIYPSQKIQIPAVSSTATVEQKVVALVNQERAKQGLKPVQADWELSRMARYKSMDMISHNYFSHQSPTYGSPFDMMKEFGISFMSAGENIAAGQTSADAVMKAWMNSPGHRANILNPSYTKIGVGLAQGGSYGYYWTQEFVGK